LRVAQLTLLTLFGCVLDIPPPVEGPCGADERECGTRCISTTEVCSPERVDGEWITLLTAADNGCGFEDWMEGSSAEARATILETDGEVRVRVDGIAGAIIALGFGGEPVFVGGVDGDLIQATFFGTRSFVEEGGCAYSVRAVLRAQVRGDTLEGSVSYTTPTNGHPSCAEFRAACVTVQRLSAVRAPPVDAGMVDAGMVDAGMVDAGMVDAGGG
jgi:hypothetical protein